jgi:hypothetical protein
VHEVITMCFLLGLGSNSPNNHGGWFNCVFRHVHRLKLMGANLRWVIGMALEIMKINLIFKRMY